MKLSKIIKLLKDYRVPLEVIKKISTCDEEVIEELLSINSQIDLTSLLKMFMKVFEYRNTSEQLMLIRCIKRCKQPEKMEKILNVACDERILKYRSSIEQVKLMNCLQELSHDGFYIASEVVFNENILKNYKLVDQVNVINEMEKMNNYDRKTFFSNFVCNMSKSNISSNNKISLLRMINNIKNDDIFYEILNIVSPEFFKFRTKNEQEIIMKKMNSIDSSLSNVELDLQIVNCHILLSGDIISNTTLNEQLVLLDNLKNNSNLDLVKELYSIIDNIDFLRKRTLGEKKVLLNKLKEVKDESLIHLIGTVISNPNILEKRTTDEQLRIIDKFVEVGKMYDAVNELNEKIGYGVTNSMQNIQEKHELIMRITSIATSIGYLGRGIDYQLNKINEVICFSIKLKLDSFDKINNLIKNLENDNSVKAKH